MSVKIKGVTIDLSGVEYVVPPLNLASLQNLQDKLSGFTGGADLKSVGIVADCALAALKRNYPEITREELLEVIDLGNMLELMNAIMGVSGLQSAGEAKGTANQ
jgi:hypothetical protein